MSIFLIPLASHEDNVPYIPTHEQILSNLRVLLRTMLKDTGSTNAFHTENPTCRVFSDAELDALLEGGLGYFNGVPHFTDFTFITLPQRWYFIVTQGAFLLGLASQGLREVGREFNITDNGVSFTPPLISGYLSTMHSAQYATYVADVDKIKSNIKPQPRSVGSFRSIFNAPALQKLRHLREKRLI